MQYTAQIHWERHNKPFDVKSYDRTHTVTFAGGITIETSSAPEFLGNAALVNPEELFTASISSCFMLTFLYWAAMKGFTVDQYQAEAVGTLGKNSEGKMCMTEVVLKPTITFGDKSPDATTLDDLFKKAHDNCFISNSVKTKVTVLSEQLARA
ncbi:MAG: OsmC family protein [uncultured bacterium]|nr:MAG: OsmC family protein [uncultured bacterium]